MLSTLVEESSTLTIINHSQMAIYGTSPTRYLELETADKDFIVPFPGVGMLKMPAALIGTVRRQSINSLCSQMSAEEEMTIHLKPQRMDQS